MAVSDFNVPNLTPAYGQIIQQLQNRAEMEGQRPSKLDIGTSLVKRADQEMTKGRDLRRAFEMEMKKEGRVLWTPEMSNDLAKDLDLDSSEFKRFEGLHIKHKEAESFAHQLKFTRSLPPDKQAAAAVIPEEAAKLELEAERVDEKEKEFKKEIRVPDSSSSTGHRWVFVYKNGTTEPGPEAPVPKEFPSLTPPKREAALRKEFATKVKDIGFRKYAEAFTVAKRAETLDKPTSPSDARLLYAWAKMLNPVGVLSDQDFRTAVEIGSYGDDVKKAFNKINQGSIMADDLRTKIINEIKTNYSQSERNLSQIENEHKHLAESEKLDYSKTISPVRPVGVTTKIMVNPSDGKRYEVEIDQNGKKKIIREVK